MIASIIEYQQRIERRRYLVLGSGIVSLVSIVLILVLGLAARQTALDPTVTPLVAASDRIYFLAVMLSSLLVGVVWYVIDPDRAIHHRINFAEIVAGKRKELGSSGGLVPAVVVFSAGLLLVVYHHWLWIVTLWVISVLLITSFAVARYAVIHDIGIGPFQARSSFFVVIPGLAFLCYSAVYLFKAPLRYTLPMMAVLTMLLMVQMIAGIRNDWLEPVGYLAVSMLIVSESAWALNYWDATWFTGGAVLALIFFMVGSLIVSRLLDQLTALTAYIRLVIVLPVFILVLLLS